MKSFYLWKSTWYAGIFFILAFLVAGCASDAPSVRKLVEMQSEKSGDAQAQKPNDYIIRPLDTIEVKVWKEPDFSGPHLVRRDGKITMPLMGDVEVAGLSTLELSAKLATLLKTYIEYPVVSVGLSQARALRVFVNGEVKTQGEFEITYGTRFIEVITKAGGFTEWAKKSKIILIRTIDGKQMRFLVDYDAIISGKDPTQNVLMKDGDIIVVP